MEAPDNLLYSADHTWLRVEDGEATIGITDFAQDQLGEVVYVELPGPGESIDQGEPFGVIESVKSVSELFAPASGEVLERNQSLIDEPTLANDAPCTDGWMLRIRISAPPELESLFRAQDYPGRITMPRQSAS